MSAPIKPPTYPLANQPPARLPAGDDCDTHTGRFFPTIARTIALQLLVSVAGVQEARQVLNSFSNFDAGWIDLKDPTRGSLGAPDAKVAEAVGELLRATPRRSVAWGEWHSVSPTLSVSPTVEEGKDLASRFPIAKVGLSAANRRNSNGLDLAATIKELHCRAAGQFSVVPVFYADYRDCLGLDFDAALELAAQVKSPYFLMDTFFKSSRNLLDHCDVGLLTGWKQAVVEHGLKLGLAGSLRLDDWPEIREVKPDIVAVRGAVCESNRTSGISTPKLRQWMKFVVDCNRLADAELARDDVAAT